MAWELPKTASQEVGETGRAPNRQEVEAETRCEASTKGGTQQRALIRA
ncbi:MAG: hypothetical protein RBU37_26795 [Myxococcota bacterium]|nr:hypothetical protein [Myxococcota bacterium]